MSQTTFDDDELFGEAAGEMREDVERHIAAARAALPAADEIWTVEADNTLGVLNGLRSALDPGEAETHLRDAKKWYTMGERADAFDDPDDLATAIAEVEEIVTAVLSAHDDVSSLATTIPELRGTLEEATVAAEETTADDDGTADEDAAAD